MPKLLQINIVSNILSTGKICEDIAKTAIAHGWETYIAYGGKGNPSVSKEYHIGSMLDEYEHYIENILFDNDGLASRNATLNLIKFIKQIRPDVIHLHNIHGHYLNYMLLFEFLNSINTPIIWTLHDCLSFTGGCAYYDKIPCDKWITECNKCPMRRKRIIDRSSFHYNLRKKLFNSNQNLVIVPVSNWLESALKKSFLKEKPIRVIHNGIDINVFKPQFKEKTKAKYGITNQYVVLGVAAPWSHRKGLYDFVKLSEMLPDEYRIMLIGLSDKQIKKLPDGIIGLPRTSSASELAEIYSMSDVFVNPTYSDNFPTVNIEALACGIPVITYKTGGSPEAVDDATGIIIEQGNVVALADAIIQMKCEKQIYSDKCRKRAIEYFDKDKCFEKYIQLYEEVITNKAR